MFKELLIGIIFSLTACSSNETTFTFTDSGLLEDSQPELCTLPFSTLSIDFNNCGDCDNKCPIDSSDRCLVGECSCGLSGLCPLEQSCFMGICITPDVDGSICEFSHECDLRHFCLQGHCTFVECTEEVCDGIDNDCDEETDETSEGFPLSRWCPEGIDFSQLQEPCQRGVQFCQEGIWTRCRGANLPVPEVGTLACDGYDNDCNGCVDGYGPECIPVTNTQYDVAIILDMSGSMREEQTAVLEALTIFAERFSRPEFRYALILMPALPTLMETSPWYSELKLDLTDYETFVRELAPLVGIVTGDQEPSWDTLAYLGEEYKIVPSWREDATRVIILVTDEDGQTYRWLHPDPSDPMGVSLPVTEASMCSSFTHGEVVAVLTEAFFNSWFDLCTELFTLTTDPTEMADALSTIISDPCGS